MPGTCCATRPSRRSGSDERVVVRLALWAAAAAGGGVGGRDPGELGLALRVAAALRGTGVLAPSDDRRSRLSYGAVVDARRDRPCSCGHCRSHRRGTDGVVSTRAPALESILSAFLSTTEISVDSH